MGDIITPELLPMTPEELLAKAKALCSELGKNFFALGEVLYEIRASEAYLTVDCGSYVEWADKELGIKTRTAQHWVDIWEVFHHRLGFTWEDVGHVGWSKLSRITSVVGNRTEAKKWLKKAEKLGKTALEEAVKAEKNRLKLESGEPPTPPRPPISRHEHDVEEELEGVAQTVDMPFVGRVEEINPDTALVEEVAYEDSETGETTPMHKFVVYLFGEQWANVMAAMERAGQLANSEKACHLMDLIAAEFNTAYAETDDGGVAHKLQWHVKNLERIYGVKIDVEVPAGSRLMHMSRVEAGGTPPSVRAPAEVQPVAPNKGRKPKVTRELRW